MSALEPNKLHVTFGDAVSRSAFVLPRRYTLTHSDLTGDLFLTIAPDFDLAQISGWYTRVMRDEVLAEWRPEPDGSGWALHLFCHVSGGLVLGTAGWRYGILRQHMPQVILAFHTGERALLANHPELESAPVIVHFQSKKEKYNKTILWGTFSDFGLKSLHAGISGRGEGAGG